MKHFTKSTSKPKTKNQSKTKTKKTRHGGKTFASSKPVKITYEGSPILCDVCKHDTYTETIGSLNKSKVRSGLGQFVLGDAAEILDTTSIIVYFCKQCGNGRMVRNADEYEKKIVAAEEA
jgi:hypothetical protein